MKLYHPTIPGRTVIVENASKVDAWIEAGWRKSAPKAAKSKDDKGAEK